MIELYWFSITIGFVVFFLVKKFYKNYYLEEETAAIQIQSPKVLKNAEPCDSQNCCKMSSSSSCSTNPTKQQDQGREHSIDQTVRANSEKIVIVYGTTTGKLSSPTSI